MKETSAEFHLSAAERQLFLDGLWHRGDPAPGADDASTCQEGGGYPTTNPRGTVRSALFESDVVMRRGALQTLLTQSFVAPRGDLQVNVDALDGRAVVQVCDENTRPLSGFEASRSIEGDHLDAVVAWPAGQLPALAVQRIRLHITLQEAQLYANWIS